MERLSGVRTLVSQLYESLNVEEHQLKKERELMAKMEALKIKLEPLEKVGVDFNSRMFEFVNLIKFIHRVVSDTSLFFFSLPQYDTKMCVCEIHDSIKPTNAKYRHIFVCRTRWIPNEYLVTNILCFFF